MLALMKKDFMVLRQTCAMIFLFLLIFAVLGCVLGNFSMLQTYYTVSVMLLPITAMSMDEKAKWDVYCTSLPVSRRAVVLSKYVFICGLAAAEIVFMLAIMTVYLTVQGEPILAGTLMQAALFPCIGLVIADIALPPVFLLGAEKGRFAMIAVIWGIVLIGMAIEKMWKLDVEQAASGFLESVQGNAMAALLALTAVITMISALCSVAIYERKELS